MNTEQNIRQATKRDVIRKIACVDLFCGYCGPSLVMEQPIGVIPFRNDVVFCAARALDSFFRM